MASEYTCRDWLVEATTARLLVEARHDGFAVGLAGGRLRPSLVKPFDGPWRLGYADGETERARRLQAGEQVPGTETIPDAYWPLDFRPPQRRVPGIALADALRFAAVHRPAPPTLQSPTGPPRQAVASAG